MRLIKENSVCLSQKKTLLIFLETHRLIDSMPNRDNENQSQAYTVTNSALVSPNGQSTSSSGMFNTEMGRKPFDFSPDHIQCMCEALQQKGDIDKLATLLYNLPKSELVRPNDSILRYFSPLASFP